MVFKGKHEILLFIENINDLLLYARVIDNLKIPS